MNLKELKDLFPSSDIEWRVQSSGLKNGKPWATVLAYIQSRAIMDRLDDVCGPENWKNEYLPGPDGGVLARISIKCGSEWITKEDGAENTQIEAVKGGISSALKRAAVPWGIGRYLYKLDVGFATFSDNGKYSAKIKDEKGKIHWFKWNPPELPDWANLELRFSKAIDYITSFSKQKITVEDFDKHMKATDFSMFKGKFKKDIETTISDVRDRLADSQ